MNAAVSSPLVEFSYITETICFFTVCGPPPTLVGANQTSPVMLYFENVTITYQCNGNLTTAFSGSIVNSTCIRKMDGSLDWKFDTSSPQCNCELDNIKSFKDFDTKIEITDNTD